MPELPEVEYFTQYFNETSLNQPIADVTCKTAALLKKTSIKTLKKVLRGKQFKQGYRRGKFLIAEIKNDPHNLIFHFGMTGSLAYGINNDFTDREKEYAQLIIEFKNGHQLRWINVRKFGTVYLATTVNTISTLKNMGPEPLSLSQQQFLDLLTLHEPKNIKSFLMDQSDIAGIGNEYSNEILFQAGIDPHKVIANLPLKDRKKLYKIMQHILKKAIAIGRPYGNFPNSWLLAHKSDLLCPRNKKYHLVKEKIAGRSALYCPKYQS